MKKLNKTQMKSIRGGGGGKGSGGSQGSSGNKNKPKNKVTLLIGNSIGQSTLLP